LEAREQAAPGPSGRNLVLYPAHVRLAAGKLLYEVGPQHAALVHAQVHDLALMAAYLVHHAAQAVAQFLDDARSEADVHQLVADLVAHPDVFLAAVAMLS